MNLNSISLTETNVVTSSISHELNTPLNAIIGFTDLILEEESIEDIKAFAAIIKNNSSLLLDKIQKVIALNSLDYENEVFLEEVSVSVLLERSQDIIAKEFGRNKRLFSISCNPTEEEQSITVFSDKPKLEKFLNHLLLSAFYLNKEGQVFLSFNVVYNNGVKEALQVLVSEEQITNFSDQQSSFEEDVDAALSTLRFEDGIGINLAICHKISKKIGGHMYIKMNNNNKVISFELPVGNLYGANNISDKEINVLVVEDEPIHSCALDRVLGEYPFMVIRTSAHGFIAGAAERLAKTDIVIINEEIKDQEFKSSIDKLLKKNPGVAFLIEESCFCRESDIFIRHNNFFYYCRNSTDAQMRSSLDRVMKYRVKGVTNTYIQSLNAG
ncbi:MAG: hypothetical protein A2X19_02045 [Bacteroidetes bacterium GWE2_39_28]|nr:MAG: hypothetical protein A2X19_02045 [Bacteroidetes bacterium GWE2_39_28]OFY12012.1 MAG: hypothetical protein A2X16_05675 [Bacteroidetes bacterium GWF2_39_10]OFZ07138.1 MAG: hypothetical protein A2322_02420 [Bacteroidetes bacterium RIFOXYB2_FULL_39_7]OFZ11267.1 MAG: hypothetical protein A2465_09025 [Bacteroidetes bacterium RIFOXYC2_FULL_39_11]HCT95116.1 hypothetical protein [Rikenellaceae bacterium]